MDSSILDNKKDFLISDYTPTYEQLVIHPEEGEDFRINDSMYNIFVDMKQLDVLLINQGYLLERLMENTVERLNIIDLNVKTEQERLQDIKMLCNKYTDFDNVIPINESTSCSGVYSVTNDSFFCSVKTYNKISSEVTNIVGNGIEGNKYVYKDGAYVSEKLDTSVRRNITDTSTTSYYEYERITCSSTEQYILSEFNTDSEPAKCTVFLTAKSEVNLAVITSDDPTLKVIGLQYSYDGVDYYPLEIPEIYMNNKQYCYDNNDYICGDNKIAFPSCKYLKITFQSVGTTDDVIAYDRVMFSHEDVEKPLEEGVSYIPITTPRAEYNNLVDATVFLNSAKRHNIKLNDISLSKNSYDSGSYFTTDNLIADGKIYSAALFANIYIPEGLDEKSLSFIFTINGTDYDVTPINMDGDNKKVFRYSQGKSKIEYTEYLDEPIVNLSLTVRMKGKDRITPFISNVKVLLGGEL